MNTITIADRAHQKNALTETMGISQSFQYPIATVSVGGFTAVYLTPLSSGGSWLVSLRLQTNTIYYAVYLPILEGLEVHHFDGKANVHADLRSFAGSMK